MVLNIDLAPTILEFAGIDIPENMQGKSLIPLLDQPTSHFRDAWFYEHHFKLETTFITHWFGGRNIDIEPSEGIRTKNFKYIRYIDQRPQYEELFDLNSDPSEKSNLANQSNYKETLDSMRIYYRQFRQSFQ